MSNLVPAPFGYSTLTLTMCAPSFEVSEYTNPNAATIGCKRGTAFQSTRAGRLGRRLPYRKCSTRYRRCRTTCLLCGATSRTAGSEYVSRRHRDPFPPQARDPEQPTIWQRHPRESVPTAHVEFMTDWLDAGESSNSRKPYRAWLRDFPKRSEAERLKPQ